MYTWNRITARSLIFLLLIIAILPLGMSNMSFASKTADAIINVSVNGSPDIYEGDEFILNILLDGTAQRITIEDTTNFKPYDGLTNLTSNVGTTAWSMRMISMGKDSELKIRVYPSKDNDYGAFSQSITIPGFKRNENNGTPVNSDTFKIIQSPVRDVIAGTDTTLEVPFELKNNVTIKSLTATIISPKDETLFSGNGTDFSTTVYDVKKTASSTAKFNVAINQAAKAKIHEIKIQFKYVSSSGVIYVDEISNSYFIRVRSSQLEPNVSVVDYKMQTNQIKAGEKQTLNISLKNNGTLTANNIIVKLSGFEKDKIRLTGDSDSKQVNILNGKTSDTVSYSISAAPAAKSDTSELTADISYIDDNGKEYKTSSKIYISIDGKDAMSIEMKVLNLKMPSHVKSKGEFSVEFDLKNVSDTEARMLEVGMEYPTATIIPRSTPKKVLRSFKPGEQQHFKYDFIVKDDAQTGFYDMYVALKYNIEGGKDTDAQTYKEFAGIFVDGAVGLGRPKVIIENYDFGGTTVLSGQEFDLALDLFNTSSEELIKNIKVSLKADDGVFAPVDMSSSFFVETIGAQAHVNKVLRLKTKSDATVKAYNLVVTFEYEDSKGNAYDAQKNAYKEEETITIPVNQPIRIETGEVTISPENYVNQPTPVSMEFFNMGRSTVYNLMVKAEGDFQVQGGNYFVGNFEAGRSDFFETQVMPTVEGEAKGKVIFMFEDANGEPGVYEKEFTMNVMSMPVDPNAGGEGDGGEVVDPNAGITPNPNGKLIIVGILAGISAVFGGTIVWKRRFERIQNARMEDEDE